MNVRVRPGLWALGLLTLTGCGDTSDTVLRTALNRKCETTDRLMKVTDEESAKKYLDPYLRGQTDRFKDLDDKWQKIIRDIEDDFRGKNLRVITFNSTGAPGSEQWQKDALSTLPAAAKDDPRIPAVRESFISYMKNCNADEARLKREKDRIALLIKTLVAERINEEKGKGGPPPRINPKDAFPSLSMILEPDTFQRMYVTGAKKINQ